MTHSLPTRRSSDLSSVYAESQPKIRARIKGTSEQHVPPRSRAEVIHGLSSIGLPGLEVPSRLAWDRKKRTEKCKENADSESLEKTTIVWLGIRSEERRVGKECVSKFRARCARYQ